MNGVIILGWHFESGTEINNNKWLQDKTLERKGCDECSGDKENIITGIYCNNPINIIINEKSKYDLYLFSHPKNKVDRKTNKNPFAEEINDIIEKRKDEEILIYLHKNPWISENITTKYPKVSLKIITGGTDPVYGKNGILNTNTNMFTNSDLSKLPWDKFWNIFYNTDETKLQLIRHIYPFLIDLKGLEKTKYDCDYYEIIKGRIKHYQEKIGTDEMQEIIKKYELKGYFKKINEKMKKISDNFEEHRREENNADELIDEFNKIISSIN